MNPARTLGPAIVAGTTTHLWIYVTGPFLGAFLAVATAWILHPHRNRGEVDAASGEPQHHRQERTPEPAVPAARQDN